MSVEVNWVSQTTNLKYADGESSGAISALLTAQSFAEYFELQITFRGSINLGESFLDKTFCFTPALFVDASNLIGGGNNCPPGSFIFNSSSANVIDVDYPMTFIGCDGTEGMNKNWNAFIRFTTLGGVSDIAVIKFRFYNTFDIRDYVGCHSLDNKYRLLKSNFDDADILTNQGDNAYMTLTKYINFKLLAIDKADTTFSYFEKNQSWTPGFIAKNAGNTAPYYQNPTFNIYVDGIDANNKLSIVNTNNVVVGIDDPSGGGDYLLYSGGGDYLLYCQIYLIRTDTNDNSVDWKENYEFSYAVYPGTGGVPYSSNKIIAPLAINILANGYSTEFSIDPAELEVNSTYRILAIWRSNLDADVNTFISDELTCDYVPEFTKDEFDVIGSLSDYQNEFMGNYLEVVPEERIQSKVNINFASDQYKDEIYNRLGLTIDNDIRTYLNKITVEIYEEYVDGVDTVKHILDRKTAVKTSFNTYTTDDGLTFEADTGWESSVNIVNDFRIRYEDDVKNLETYVNEILQPEPLSNEDWTGNATTLVNKTLYIEYKFEFYYDDYAIPFYDIVSFKQKLSVKHYGGTKYEPPGIAPPEIITVAEITGDAYVCFGEEICFDISKDNVELPDDYKLIGLVDSPVFGINNIEENDPFVGVLELQETDKVSSMDEDLIGAIDSEICIDTSKLEQGKTYKVSVILKKKDESFILTSDADFLLISDTGRIPL